MNKFKYLSIWVVLTGIWHWR